MAKKSAASKGYRKTVKKKPFLTKNEIIALIAIVALIVVGLVAFNLFYDDGYLEAKDLQPNDVVASVSREVRNRYRKVADAKEIDGFTLNNENWKTAPASEFIYTPDEPIDNISYLSLNGSFVEADELSNTSMGTLQSFNSQGSSFAISDRTTTSVQGHDAYIYTYTSNYYQAPEGETAEETADGETPESNIYGQTINLYVHVDDNRTICFRVYFTGEDDSYYMTDDEAINYILNYAEQAFTVYDGEEEAA